MMKRIAVGSPTNSLEKIRAALLRKATDVCITTVSRRLRFQFDLIYHIYLPYLFYIHEKANCIAIFWTERQHSLGS